MSLFSSPNGLDVDNFNLKSQSPDDEKFGILCEKGKVLTENNCIHISHWCLLAVIIGNNNNRVITISTHPTGWILN